MVMIIVTEKVEADERSEARSILLIHRPETEAGGLCCGCYEHACSFAWFPCPQARWAQSILATPGGGDHS